MNLLQPTNRVRFGAVEHTWQGLREAAALRYGEPAAHAGQRLVFVVDTAQQAFAALAYGIGCGLDMGVIERGRLAPDVESRLIEHGVQQIDAGTGQRIGPPAHAGVPAVPGRVTVFTSGTTGTLKLVAHTPATLNTFGRVKTLSAASWFCPYQVGSYAWYQMAVLGLFMADQTLVLPGDGVELMVGFEAALRAGLVSAVSSTPTFWRQALMSIDEAVLKSAALQTISMGGEIVDQAILDRLASLYPAARLRHIYASSEAGAALVVGDGLAGFDAALLDREGGTVRATVRDGRLFIRSPYGHQRDVDDWIDTGDLVELRGARVHFLGRADRAVINVGGQKAYAPDIEARLMTHPEVQWVRVAARRAPMVGQLPVARVVLRKGGRPDDSVEQRLGTHCRLTLPEHAVPRLWEFLDQIPLEASLKS
jgi:acyl-coenzyme A synthetase/AMP-(fatty) acid ligase